jgi:uncharacterized membrane protein YwzB
MYIHATMHYIAVALQYVDMQYLCIDTFLKMAKYVSQLL